MATSRSHVKRRFTPYQSIANTFEAKVNRQRLLLARRNKEAIATLGQEYNFWSQLSDEALFSIVQQACSKDQGSDDTVESSTLQYSMDPSLHEITEAFAGKCSVNRSPDEIIALFSRQCSLQTPGSTSVHKVSSASSRKTKTQFPLLKDIPELHGLTQFEIVTRCFFEMIERSLSLFSAENFSSRVIGDIEELRQITLRCTTFNKYHAQVTGWMFERLTGQLSMLPDSLRQ